jgi:thioredoxin-related protein
MQTSPSKLPIRPELAQGRSSASFIIHYLCSAIFFIAIYAVFMPAIGQISSQNTAPTRKETILPTPADLRAAAQAAQLKGEPLVVLISLPGCPWCELLRRNYLLPMRSEGLHAFQWNVHDSNQRIIGFQGQNTNPAQLSKAYKYSTTPTVLFLSTTGEEIAPRIEGIASADFIGAVLDERIALARERLKTNK